MRKERYSVGSFTKNNVLLIALRTRIVQAFVGIRTVKHAKSTLFIPGILKRTELKRVTEIRAK